MVSDRRTTNTGRMAASCPGSPPPSRTPRERLRSYLRRASASPPDLATAGAIQHPGSWYAAACCRRATGQAGCAAGQWPSPTRARPTATDGAYRGPAAVASRPTASAARLASRPTARAANRASRPTARAAGPDPVCRSSCLPPRPGGDGAVSRRTTVPRHTPTLRSSERPVAHAHREDHRVKDSKRCVRSWSASPRKTGCRCCCSVSVMSSPVARGSRRPGTGPDRR